MIDTTLETWCGQKAGFLSRNLDYFLKNLNIYPIRVLIYLNTSFQCWMSDRSLLHPRGLAKRAGSELLRLLSENSTWAIQPPRYFATNWRILSLCCVLDTFPNKGKKACIMIITLKGTYILWSCNYYFEDKAIYFLEATAINSTSLLFPRKTSNQQQQPIL